MRDKRQGIALVSLVITIIVLLILAGVAVNIVINSDSIFAKANQAKEDWNEKVVAQEDTVWDALNKIGVERPVQPDGDAPTKPQEVTINTNNLTLVATGGTDESSDVAGYQYSLDQVTWSKIYPEGIAYKIGEEIGEKPSWESIAGTKQEESEVMGLTKSRTAPIPQGFTASNYAVTGFIENTIEKGLVIYEGTEDVNDENHNTAMTTRNQFVWIPVDDINDMVMCTGNGEEQETTVYIRTVDTTGNVSEVDSQDVVTTKCNLVFDDTGNLICTTHMLVPENTHFLCGRLYGGGTSFGSQDPTTYGSGFREPAVVTDDNYIDTTTGKGYHGYASSEEFFNSLKNQFTQMAKSVATYGGFYVGRYEAGCIPNDENIQYTTRKNTDKLNILTPLVQSEEWPAGVGNWYGLYSRLLKTNVGSSSHMIWGCQWDQVMKFINGKNDNNGIGNLYSVTTIKVGTGSRHTGNRGATGANTNDLVQNIYDLEGNLFEWISMTGNNDNRAIRGGVYHSTSDNPKHTSSMRNSGIAPTRTYQTYTSRPTLYIMP